MKKLAWRVALLLLSDQHVMDLYVSVQLRFYKLAQQSQISYWIAEGTVYGISEDQLPNWASQQANASRATVARLTTLRQLIMSSRRALFVNHKHDPLDDINFASSFILADHPAGVKYRELTRGNKNDHYQRTT